MSDQAIKIADPPAQPLARFIGSLTVAMGLRLLGGLALAFALAQFLLNGVDVQNDLERFGLLLLQTGLFAAGAFTVQRVFADLSSARLLFGVALLSVPVGFTVLGAMLYSTAPLDGVGWLESSGMLRGESGYPDYARWQAAGAVQILIASLGALLVLVPTAAFAHAVFARRSAVRLTLWLIGGCLMLLVPVRDPALTGLLAGASVIVLPVAMHRLADADPALATFEGRFALAMLTVPSLIVVMRTALMYEPGLSFLIPVTGALYLACRSAMQLFGAGSIAPRILHPIALLAAAALAAQTSALFESRLDQITLVILTIAGVALAADLRRVGSAGRLVACLEAVLIVLTLALLALATLVGTNSLVALLAATPVLVFTLLHSRTWLAALTGIVMLASAGTLFDDLWQLMRDHGWQSSIALGLAAVLGAAMLERFGTPLRRLRRARVVDAANEPVEYIDDATIGATHPVVQAA